MSAHYRAYITQNAILETSHCYIYMEGIYGMTDTNVKGLLYIYLMGDWLTLGTMLLSLKIGFLESELQGHFISS